MKNLGLKITVLLLTTFFLAGSAFAGVQGYNGTTNLGIFDSIKCSTGLTCSRSVNKLNIVGNTTISTGAFNITGTASGSAVLSLWANAGAAAADKFSISADTTDSMIFKNSTNTLMTLSTGGSLSVAGGLVVSSGVFKNYGFRWQPSTLTTGTSTTPSATVVYLTQIYVPANMTVSGVKINNGATVGTNKYIVALFNSAGTPVANSDLNGYAINGADSYQQIPFQAQWPVMGPGVYWIGLYVNGTTDRFRSIPAVGESGGLAGSVTGQTFGTVSAVALPTTFTADKGPIAFLY